MDSSRTALLIGQDGLEKLAKKHITIVGIGGVGGMTALMLARAGIEKLRLIDFDIVSTSNINRQAVAFISTVGKPKVDVMQNIISQINEDAQVEAVKERLSNDNLERLLAGTDLVVDAIDSVSDKIALIVYCKKHNINIISAMGAGNRKDIPIFECVDIFKTHDDALAKVVRKRLREEGIDNLDVVTSFSKGQKSQGVIGSISYYPNMCGCTLAAVVINKILGGEYEIN